MHFKYKVFFIGLFTLSLMMSGCGDYTEECGECGSCTSESNDSNATTNNTVTPVNNAPLAMDDKATLDENTNVTINILSNDSDSDGTIDVTTLKIVTSPTNGTVTVKDGKVIYTPTENYYGTDSFTYTIRDNEGLVSNVATVLITVIDTTIDIVEANHKPLAQEQNLSTKEDTKLSIILVGTDEDHNTLSYRIVTQPNHGTISGTAPNIIYTPNTNYVGSDSFSFNVNDGKINSSDAIVSIEVTPVNDPPIAVDDSVKIKEGDSVSIRPLKNDKDLDGGSLTIVSIGNPQYGKVILEDNIVYYAPTENNEKRDFLEYTITDGQGGSAKAIIHILVSNTDNDLPIAYGDNIETNEDTPISIELNASDPDGDNLHYTITHQPKFGLLSGSKNKYIYTPNSNYTGEDYFIFKVNDDEGDSNSAGVHIVVHPLNDPPVADAGDDYVGIKGDSVNYDGSKSYDIDNDPLTYEWKEGNTILSTQKIFDRISLIEGIHTVILTVTDEDNLSSSDEKIITIKSCCKGCTYPDPTQTNPYK